MTGSGGSVPLRDPRSMTQRRRVPWRVAWSALMAGARSKSFTGTSGMIWLRA